jgi:hypothetical protein
MIRYKEEYSINNGSGNITFQKGAENEVSAVYNRGTIHAEWHDDVLKGIFLDTQSKGRGLIEFTFAGDTFEAKWKGGINPGPMRGRWNGVLNTSVLEKNPVSIDDEIKTVFNSSDQVEIRVVVQKFDFYSENIVSETAEIFDLVGLEYESINWRNQSELIEDYWWKQEEEFYQFLYENDVENDASEYSDWYEFEIRVVNDEGELVFNEIVRG